MNMEAFGLLFAGIMFLLFAIIAGGQVYESYKHVKRYEWSAKERHICEDKYDWSHGEKL